MATRKAAKKSTKKTARKLIPKRVQPLYGRPIDKVIQTGDLAEMKKVATQARTYLKNVKSALAALDRKIGRAG
jgi:hypothetical protein